MQRRFPRRGTAAHKISNPQNKVNAMENLDIMITEQEQFLQELLQRMRGGAAKFRYYKADGSLREAIGTLSPAIIPADKMPKGGTNPAAQYGYIAYFDVERQDWRQFLAKNLLWYEL